MRYLPNSWQQVTIKDFLIIKQIIEKEKDDLEREIKILSYLYEAPAEEVERQTIDKIKKDIRHIAFMNSTDMGPLKVRFKLKGQRFEACVFSKGLNGAQFMDLSELCKDGDMIANMHKVLAVICTPVKGWPLGKRQPYDGKLHAKYSELFYNHMPMSVAYPLAVFFCESFKNCIPAIQDCLRKGLKKQIKQVQAQMNKSARALSSIGDGSQP